ncbi:MAG: LysR family transcriptional regulator [Hyphomicrobiales bacterium]
MEYLDSELLRTFIAVNKAGSVTDGASQIHRSQSATSLQIKRLESIIGRPVFERHGRGVVLTDAGRYLLPVAQDVTTRLDNVLNDLSQRTMRGALRLGIPEDHGRAKLAQIIANFMRVHPQVELDVTCALSVGFPDALEKGRLDMAVYEVEHPAAGEELLFEDPTCWVASDHTDFSSADPLPVALFDEACWWREAALASLQSRDKPYRVVYSSQSVSGVIAGIEAGVAVGLVGRSSIPPSLSMVSSALGFGPTPTSKLVLATGSHQNLDLIAAMKSAIRSGLT